MKKVKFSVTTLLFLTAILAMAVHIVLQNKTLTPLRNENSGHREELGKFDEYMGERILVRPLMNRGPNTWRYRIYKEDDGFRYGFGVVDLDSQGAEIIPSKRNRSFHWMLSKTQGEVGFVFSVARSAKTSIWYYTLMEFLEYGNESPASARLQSLSVSPETPIWNFQPPVTVVNDLTQMTANKTNGPVTSFETNETVVLFRSESPLQTSKPAQAFVVVLQKIPESKSR